MRITRLAHGQLKSEVARETTPISEKARSKTRSDRSFRSLFVIRPRKIRRTSNHRARRSLVRLVALGMYDFEKKPDIKSIDRDEKN